MSVSLQHIHIVAEEKYALAKWYQEHLGFEILDDIEKRGEKEGPLFISADGGKTGLSIFNRQPRHKTIGTTCIPAFEVDPEQFVLFYKKLKQQDSGLTVYDHLLFYSFYTVDPSTTKIEITSLKYKEMKALLAKEGIESLAMNPAASKD